MVARLMAAASKRVARQVPPRKRAVPEALAAGQQEAVDPRLSRNAGSIRHRQVATQTCGVSGQGDAEVNRNPATSIRTRAHAIPLRNVPGVWNLRGNRSGIRSFHNREIRNAIGR